MHSNIFTSFLDEDFLSVLSEYFCWAMSWFTIKTFKILKVLILTSQLFRIFTGNKRLSCFLNFLLIFTNYFVCGCGCQFQRFSVVDRRSLGFAPIAIWYGEKAYVLVKELFAFTDQTTARSISQLFSARFLSSISANIKLCCSFKPSIQGHAPLVVLTVIPRFSLSFYLGFHRVIYIHCVRIFLRYLLRICGKIDKLISKF